MSDEISTARIPSIMMEDRESTGGFEEERLKRRLKERLAGSTLPPVKIDRFVVLRRLGAGGLGIIYEAYDPFLDRRVALKLVRPSASASSGQVDAMGSLLREAQAMAQLSHRNVLPVHDAGEHEGSVFLVLELVQGDDLAAYLRGRKLPWREVMGLYLQAGRGLAAAHAAGLVHRDFKPSNVMVGADGRVQVMDFGLALPLGELAATASSKTPGGSVEAPPPNAAAGTPAYMAPEQLRGEFVDARSDIFSFCVSLYEGLFGVRPFKARDKDERLQEIAEGKLDLPKSAVVPGWVLRILRRGLSERARDRFTSMEALLAQLEHGLKRRRRWLWATASVLTLGLGAAAFSRSPPACEDAGERLKALWNDETRREITARFEASEMPYAADSWSRVSASLDAHGRAWAEVQNENCRATKVEERQSVDLMHRRYACLERDWSEYRSLVVALRDANETTVEGAIGAATSLRDPAACDADMSVVEEGSLPPPKLLEQVESARRQLTQSRTLRRLGEVEKALALTAELARSESVRAYPPLAVETSLEAARGQIDEGEPDAGAKALESLLVQAEAAGHVQALAEALVELTYVRGVLLAHWEEGLVWGKVAEAAVLRAGDLPELNVGLHLMLGRIMVEMGHPERAGPELERAFEISLSHFGEGHPQTTKVLSGLATAAKARGELPRALELREEILERTIATYGRDHPESALASLNLGATLSTMSRHEEALLHHERALDIWTRTLPPKHVRLSLAHGNVAVELSQLGRTDEAIVHYEKERELVESLFGVSHPRVSRTHHNLAMVYLRAGRLEQALEEIELAEGAGGAVFGTSHPRAADLASTRGDILMAMGRLDEALMAYESAAKIIAGAEDADPALQVQADLSLGEVHIARGDRERAERHVQAARAGAVPLASAGRAGYLGVATYLEARLLWDQTLQRARAMALLREASRLLRSQGGIFWGETAERAERLLARGEAEAEAAAAAKSAK